MTLSNRHTHEVGQILTLLPCFLIFDDDSYMEIYGERMNCAIGLSSGGVDAAEEYAIINPKII